ncbi:MAG: hypothetical protein PHX03_04235 [Bacilli bacterium]|nr:hypothetical protein [Bacilli bacterium]MDD4719214.1 hypothetical protein [Bacilli bacterium]
MINKIKKRRSNKRLFETFQKNYAWFIAIITTIGIIILNVFKFIEYITANVYFSYYGLDINLYKYNDQGFIYGLCLSFLFMLALYSLLYCIRQLYFDIKNKNFKAKEIIGNLSIIIFSNLYIILVSNIEFNLPSFLINMAVLIAIELVLSITMLKKLDMDKTKVDSKQELINYFKTLPFIIIILIFSISLRTTMNLIINKSYRVIDDNKVIVYTNSDYYLTLDCKIENNNMIIYKGTQSKINNENVYSKLNKYNKIKFK